MVLSAQYVHYAAQGMTPKQVASLTGCHRKTAKQQMTRAYEELTANEEAAVALLERSSLATAQLKAGVSSAPVMSKSRWEDIILGICHLPPSGPHS